MARNPSAVASFTFIDYGDEISSTLINLPVLDDTNIAATQTALLALESAIATLSLCGHIKTTRSGYIDNNARTGLGLPATAQREVKFLFVLQDTVTLARSRVEVPGADPTLAGLLIAGRGDEIDITQTTVAAFVTALEAVAVSNDGNAVEVVEGFLVGRNI